MVIYQIIKEALNNVCQHSKATRAIVSLDFVAPDFRVRIEDNGQGFKIAQDLVDSTIPGSSGIGRMWQQASLVNGKLNISSERGKGTVIDLVVQL